MRFWHFICPSFTSYKNWSDFLFSNSSLLNSVFFSSNFCWSIRIKYQIEEKEKKKCCSFKLKSYSSHERRHLDTSCGANFSNLLPVIFEIPESWASHSRASLPHTSPSTEERDEQYRLKLFWSLDLLLLAFRERWQMPHTAGKAGYLTTSVQSGSNINIHGSVLKVTTMISANIQIFVVLFWSHNHHLCVVWLSASPSSSHRAAVSCLSLVYPSRPPSFPRPSPGSENIPHSWWYLGSKRGNDNWAKWVCLKTVYESYLSRYFLFWFK